MGSRAVSETRVVMTLSLLYVFRMLGLFMVFPVLTVYGADYAGATPLLLGLALGGYGITQALFQIPLGMLSDLLGRKSIIIAGLLVFCAGSVIAATADTVWGLVLGRIIQGAGAIASTVMALLGDLTSEQNRTRAMAVIGISIGVSFTLAMISGPALAGALGLASVFWLAAILACVGIAIVVWLVPTPIANTAVEHRPVTRLLASVMADRNLVRLDFGIAALHFALTATFVVVPVALASQGLPAARQWSLYLPVMLGSFILMLPLIYLAERKRQLKKVFLGAIAALVVAEVTLAGATSLAMLIGGLLLFFVAFNLLEASLPSLVSKLAPAGSKGTAMGVYSTSQFLGASLGGLLGGWIYGVGGISAALALAGGACALWWLLALRMPEPRFLASIAVPCVHRVEEQALMAVVPGVVEVRWAEEHSMLYLKVESERFDKVLLRNYLGRVA